MNCIIIRYVDEASSEHVDTMDTLHKRLRLLPFVAMTFYGLASDDVLCTF